jgi:hypothetical protein
MTSSVLLKPPADDITDVCTRVRRDAADVMAAARDIRINEEKIAAYARMLVDSCPLVTELDRENHFVDDASPAATAAYILALDSINFGSGVFAAAERAGIVLEYAPVAKSLKAVFLDGRLHDPEEWLQLTSEDCHAAFKIPAGVDPALDQLMHDFCRHLHMTAWAIQKDLGDMATMLTGYRGRGPDLLEVFCRWPHFRDVTAWQDREVAIFKRAQIMLADLELALGKPDTPHFGGLGQLTCFADNMVPHVLRADGVLAYSDALARIIDKGEMIPAGSAAEAELRCAAIHAVELMREALGGRYTSVNLDHMLWHRGYEPGFSPFKPHRTVSTWY